MNGSRRWGVCVCVCVCIDMCCGKLLGHVWFFATLWTPGCSVHWILRQEYWSVLPCPPPHTHTHTHTQWNIVCLVTQSCSTVCNLRDCSPPGSSVHGDSPGKNTGVGCHAPVQGIFSTQGSNSGLLRCRWILYHLSHQESPQWNITHLLRKNEIMPFAAT